MPDGQPLRLGVVNTSNARTRLNRNRAARIEAFIVRNPNGGVIQGEALGPMVGGVGGPGVAGFSDSDVGVFGYSDQGNGVEGGSLNQQGVLAWSDNGIGVAADAWPGTGLAVWGSCDNGDAIRGESRNGRAGYFQGRVEVVGDFTVTRSKSAVVPHPDGSHRMLYSLECPESWFEDFGRAQLTDGQAQVELDGDFAAVVSTYDYHVFLTPEGDSQGLYVSSRSPGGFEVREQQGGKSTLEFSYRVVAKRKDVEEEAERLQRVEVAPPPTIEVPRPRHRREQRRSEEPETPPS